MGRKSDVLPEIKIETVEDYFKEWANGIWPRYTTWGFCCILKEFKI